MKFLVISDTHGAKTPLWKILSQWGESVDGVIHLGDYVRDAREAAKVYPNLPFYLVAGNGDSGTAAPSNQILELEGHRLYLCHGHRHLAGGEYQGFLQFGLDQECDVLLCGHTHVPHLEDRYGVLILNPGSLCFPRSSAGASYAILDTGGKRADARIHYVEQQAPSSSHAGRGGGAAFLWRH